MLVSLNSSTFELDPATGQVGRQIANGDDGVVSPNRMRVAYVRDTDPCASDTGPGESTTTSTAPEEPTTTVPEEPPTTLPEEPTTTVPEAPTTTVEETTTSTAPQETTTTVPQEPTTTSKPLPTTTSTVAGATTTTTPVLEPCYVATTDLLTADITGTGERTIVDSMDDGVQRYSPDWSPDGSRIMFSWLGEPGEGHGLAWVRPDGSGLEQLKFGALDGAFSPDGKRIAYVDFFGDVHVMSVATRQTTALTTGGTAGASSPDWSPDGKRIAYASYQQGVFVLDVKTGQAVNIIPQGWSVTGFQTPVWSPDGQEIAFAATDLSAYPEGEAVSRIYAVSPSGGTPRTVADQNGELTDWLRL